MKCIFCKSSSNTIIVQTGKILFVAHRDCATEQLEKQEKYREE